jgi:hypothetical protein
VTDGRVDPEPEAIRLVRESPGHYSTRMLRKVLIERTGMSRGDVYAALTRLEVRGELTMDANEDKRRKRRLRYYLGPNARKVSDQPRSRARVDPVVVRTHPHDLPPRPRERKAKVKWI